MKIGKTFSELTIQLQEILVSDDDSFESKTYEAIIINRLRRIANESKRANS